MRKKHLAVISFLIIFAIGVPLTLFIFNKQQELRSRAEKSTTLYFSPSSTDANPITTHVGNTLPLDIMINPGTNLVSLMKLEIQYDPTKFEIAPTTPFQANLTSFSQVAESPLFSQGKMTVTMSIGTDLSKVINQTTRVGTLKLKALKSTIESESTTTITYGPNTQVLAIGANANANENVLSNTQPAIIAINPIVPTITPTNVPPALSPITCPLDPQGKIIVKFSKRIRADKTQADSESEPITTSIPAGNYKITLVSYDDHLTKQDQYQPAEKWYVKLKDSTGKNVASSNSINDLPDNKELLVEQVNANLNVPQKIVSALAVHAAYPNSNPNSITPVCAAFETISPTITSVPDNTKLLLTALLDGIGSRGDNSNPESSLSNKEPLHTERNVKANIFDVSNKLVSEATGTVNYSSTSGSFTGSISSTISSGNYTIKITVDNHLTRLLPGIQKINSGQTNQLSDAVFVAGDIVSDNQLNILDYNVLIDCYSDLSAATACNEQKKIAADFNDDGSVNQFDYNLFLRELTTQPGQ